MNNDVLKDSKCFGIAWDGTDKACAICAVAIMCKVKTLELCKSPIAEEEPEEETPTALEDLSLNALIRKAEGLGIKVTKKNKNKEALIQLVKEAEEEEAELENEIEEATEKKQEDSEEAMDEPIEDSEDSDEFMNDEEEDADYSTMTLDELYQEVMDRGLEYTGRKNKKKLIRMLEEDDKSEEEADSDEDIEEETEDNSEEEVTVEPEDIEEEPDEDIEEEPDEDSDEDDEEEELDYYDMSLSELLDLAKERGYKSIKGKKDTKKILIKFLERQDEANEEEEEEPEKPVEEAPKKTAKKGTKKSSKAKEEKVYDADMPVFKELSLDDLVKLAKQRGIENVPGLIKKYPNPSIQRMRFTALLKETYRK